MDEEDRLTAPASSGLLTVAPFLILYAEDETIS